MSDKPFAENGEEFWGTLRCVQMWLEGADDMTAQSVYDVLAKTLGLKEREIDVDKIQLEPADASKSNVEADLRRKRDFSTSTGVSIENATPANENAQIVTVAHAFKNALWRTGELRRGNQRISAIEVDGQGTIWGTVSDGFVILPADIELEYTPTPRADGSAAEAEVERLRAALSEIDERAPISQPEPVDWGRLNKHDFKIASQARTYLLWELGELARAALKGEGDK